MYGVSAGRTRQAPRHFARSGETRSADVVANVAICLIHQANYLLDRLVRRLERDFIEQGGLRERMTKRGGPIGASKRTIRRPAHRSHMSHRTYATHTNYDPSIPYN
jgi:four helix bundle suffix protein